MEGKKAEGKKAEGKKAGVTRWGVKKRTPYNHTYTIPQKGKL